MELYNSHTDEYLFSLLKNNDEGAFTELYNRYWKKLLSRAVFLLKSQEEAEEVALDTFVAVWKKRNTINLHHSFYTYISAMLKYACLKVLAKRKNHYLSDTTDNLEVADRSTQQWLAFQDLQEELEMAVKELPDKCQLVFRLSREQYLSDKEIAGELDLSVNTVRTQMHRALKKLKTSLGSLFLF